MQIRLLSSTRERQELESPSGRIIIEPNVIQLAPGQVAHYEQFRWRVDSELYMTIQIVAPLMVQFQRCRMGALESSHVIGPFEELWLVGPRLVTPDLQVLASRHPIAECWEHRDDWVSWSRVVLLACESQEETANA